MKPTKFEKGVTNLLLNCAGASAGDKILLVGEIGENPFFASELCGEVQAVAETLGLTAHLVLSEAGADWEDFPTEVRTAMEAADQIIFFSRLGDQARFALNGPNAIMTYTLDSAYLADPFAGVDFATTKRLHDHLLSTFLDAETYRITGACGTDLTGRIDKSTDGAVVDFALELFPIMIFPPIRAVDLNGTLVLDRFVTSSSTRAYENSTLCLEVPIRITVDASRMVAFDGHALTVDRLTAQLARAAELTGGDPFRINSWHTGINPNTYFNGDPYADLERWGTVAYGSPRYTHMHAAGNDPGDVAFHLFDATITFDDQVFWDEGRFTFLDRPEVQEMIGEDMRPFLNASVVRSIGI